MERMQDPHASGWPAVSPVETLSLAEPCVVWLRPSWPLMVVGGLVVADAAPHAGSVALGDIAGWSALRALLLHGVALRDRLALLPSADLDRAHTPRELLRVIERQGERWWQSLLIRGARQGWRHREAHAPAAERAALAAAWTAAGAWRAQVLLQATLWPVAAAEVAALVDSPAECLEVLETVVGRVGQFVDDRAPRLPRAERRTYADAEHAFRHLVGRSLGPGTESRGVRDVTAVPTPGLAGAIPIARSGQRWTVWIPLDVSNAESPPDVHRTLALLGDPLNQQVVEQLAGGPSYAQALAPTLNTHASTLSRHLTALADAGIVRVRPEGHRVWYHLHAPTLQAVENWATQVRTAVAAAAPGRDGSGPSPRP